MELLLLIIIVALVLAYFAAPLWAWFVALGALLLATESSLLWWIPSITLAVVLLIKEIRVKLITQPIFEMLKSKGLLPKISETEKTALRAGDVWVEGELFSGKPDFKKIFDNPYPELSEDEQAFINNEVNVVCAMTSDWEVFEKRDLP